LPQSVVPSPEQLVLYANAGEHIPLAIIRARTDAAKMEYRYAMAGLAIAGIGLVSVVGGFIFLVIYGHPKAAAALLGAGILSLISAFIKTRLTSQ
jgi:hypothetical protein